MRIALIICTSFISQIMNGQFLGARQTQQDTTRPGTFSLGEVGVIGWHSGNINTTIDARQIRLFAKNDVSRALNVLSGVNLSAVGPRNEAMVYIRGFDLRQVPLLIKSSKTLSPFYRELVIQMRRMV
jgi:iron complex outermembrane receptor protein